MTTYPDVDLDCAIASCMCGDATKAQQNRVYRHLEELQKAYDELLSARKNEVQE